MSGWEYKVIPAPNKGIKGAGIKGPEARFANAIEGLMNDMGAQGWEYQRAETLPSVERSGLTGSTTEWRNVLVFRRAATTALDDFEPELLPPPAPAPTVQNEPPAQTPDADATKDGDDTHAAAVTDAQTTAQHPTEGHSDNGVEDTSDMQDITASLKNLAAQRTDLKSES